MKHVLCMHLPQWPIDRLRRRRPELRHKAFALIETIGARQRVTHVSPEAPAGIFPGMTPAEAKAHHAGLICLPESPADDARSLEALGRWLMRFSPNVCLYPPSSLFLDATGLQRLFGGLDQLRRRVAHALAKLGISAEIAIAPTPGAAWALAAFGRGDLRIVGGGELLDALAALPPEAMRLDRMTVEMLAALGIRSIGSLLKLPRDDLAVRFGRVILQRIDQATGAVHEPLTFLEYHAPILANVEFDGAIESLQTIHLALRQLVAEVARQLAGRGLGARELRMTFRPPYAPIVEKVVGLARPSRDESALFNLLCCATEAVETREGFIAAGLSATRIERLGDEQPALIGGEEERNAAELDHLLERLRARLEGAVQWAELVESHVPEQSFRCRENPVVSDVRAGGAAVFRPICLLPAPRAIRVIVMPSDSRDGLPISFTDQGEVHRLAHVFGPERITGQWWNGRWKTRDYFDVLDAMGNRYWLFRVADTGRWFMHGVFE
ncbi:MAG: DNA polymerase Y family protein [Tepidisphaeraceae bacterium]